MNWLRYDKPKKKCYVKFMDPPYNAKTNKMLYTLIKSELEAPDHWKEYPVKLLGHATFAEADARLKLLLGNQKYIAYSSESDMPSKEKAKLVMTTLKNKQPCPDFREIMQVPKFVQMIDKRMEVNSVIDERHDAEILSDGETPNLCSTNFDETYKSETTESQKNSQLFDSRKRIHSPVDNAIPSTSKCIRECLTDVLGERNQIYLDLDTLEFNADYIPEDGNNLNDTIGSQDKESDSSEEDEFIQTPQEISCSRKYVSFANNEIPTQIIKNRESGIRVTKKPSFSSRKKIRPPNSHRQSTKSPNSEKCDVPMSAVLKEIKFLREEIRDVRENQVILKNMFENVVAQNYIAKLSFAQQYNLDLPFKTLEEMKTFTTQMQNDEECCKMFKSSLALLVDQKNLLKSVRNIIKKYMSRDFAMQFTAIKKMPGKELFREYNMCRYIVDIMNEKFLVSEDEVLVNIGTVFTNSKDWEGHRKSRT